jgi:FHA domain
MALSRDLTELALRVAREEFVRLYDAPFLVGKMDLRPHGVLGAEGRPRFEPVTLDGESPRLAREDGPLALAIQKAQTRFVSMITLGRAANNDLCLDDSSISRFHAFFRRDGARLEVGDAGSRNGTWLAGRRLPSKGPMQAVALGDALRFGSLTFVVQDAAGCWDDLHACL